MRTISKDNVYNVEVCQKSKPYLAPCTEVIDVECRVSILAGSGEDNPNTDVDNDHWANDKYEME